MEPWHYDTAEDLDQAIVERLRRFPREPDMSAYALRTGAALGIRAWMRTYHRLSIVGRENLPKEGSYLLVANHASHLDTLAILSALPLAKLHRVFPAAAKDFFFESLPRTAVAAIVVNALPFDRETHIRQSLTLCKTLLEKPGNVLLLFPEGTRTMTGEMGEFRPGIGLLVAGSPWPVVPCHLEGTYQAWPKGTRLPRPRKVRLIIGQSRSYAELKRGKEAAQTICQELRDAVLALATKQGEPNT
jgi:1-acyl-sn-glycerol-3-phosphate acyltransferase